MRHRFSLSLSALVLASTAAAQTTQFVQITDSVSGTAYTAGSQQHRMAISGTGDIYAVMKKGSPMVIFKSSDAGATWSQVASDTTGGNPSGNGIVADPNCDLLHVGFHARVGTNKEAPYHRVFNTATDQWVGPATLVYNGATATQDFRFADIACTPKGSVVVAFKSPSSAPTGFKNSAGYFAVKKAGQTAFSAPFQVSTGGNGSGLRNTMHAIGEIVHMVFRYSSGGHNVTYRAFNTETMAFVGPQVVIDGPKATPASPDITNFVTSAITDDGTMYVMYGVGDLTSTGKGEIKMAWASAPYSSWTIKQVATDANLLGKKDTKNMSVVHVGGNQIVALYSKQTPPDDQDKLYARELVNGTFGPEQTLLTKAGRTFQTIWGHRTQQSRTGFIAFVHDESGGSQRNMWFVNNSGKAGRVRFFANSCKGNRTEQPTLSTNLPPEAGKLTPPLRLTMGNMPANSAGALFLGARCLPTPIDLAAIGAPGCVVAQDPLISIGGFATDASGNGQRPLIIPANFADIVIRFQALVLAPGANGAGFLLTRGISINP